MLRGSKDGEVLRAYAENFSSRDAELAYFYMIGWSSALTSYECFPSGHGHIKDFRFMRGENWDFAFIPNRKWLLFYFRAPCLRLPKYAKSQIIRRFPAAKETSSGEITIRIASVDDAVSVSAYIES